MTKPTVPRRVRLGEFQLDVDAGELFGNGTSVRLQVQSLELLKALLERPGQMVSREELRQRLWPRDTFVDFEHGLNAAVRRLREVLGDTAEKPRFVETIPRRGYRLVAETDSDTPAPTSGASHDAPFSRPAPTDTPAVTTTASRTKTVRSMAVSLLVAVVVAVWAGAWLWKAPPPSSHRPPVATFTIDLPTGWNMRVLDMVAVSPDSRQIAFTAVGPDARRALWVRPLAGTTARALSAILADTGRRGPMPFPGPTASRSST
jgi:DNA-binding winged helix-turn-helix (wHTH) protein